ncbi:hypothetical protein NMY22_g9388 [Coprinellus aureogranulatus]|nr:hypothetical protein NMY22_g9388 [Coprinellus aureogranulatus]
MRQHGREGRWDALSLKRASDQKMAMTEEQIQRLADTVAMWRMQEYVLFRNPWLNSNLSKYPSTRSTQVYPALFVEKTSLHPAVHQVYYMLTTIREEVSVIYAQKWNLGKILFLVVRYGICIDIALELTANYRNYYVISPKNCKVILVAYDVAYRLAILACDISLGLCLSALLQARQLYLCLIMLLCVGPSIVRFIFQVVSDIQLPVESISSFDEELGYPCYCPSTDDYIASTVTGLGLGTRAYVQFATTTLLLLLAVSTVFFRYRGHKGRLIHIIRRDGGLQIMHTAVRFAFAILNTPAVMAVDELLSNPVYHSSEVVVPVLAQRLMVNMRKIDYMGSRPFASKLLFAPPEDETQSDLKNEIAAISGSSDMSYAPWDPEGKREAEACGTSGSDPLKAMESA